MQDSTFANLLAGIAIALVLMVCFTMPASGSFANKDLYVFLLTENCNDQTMMFAEKLLSLPSQYDAYLDYDKITAVCFGGLAVNDIDQILPTLRHVWPDAHFLFVYDDADNATFKTYVSSQGYSGKGSFYGQAFLKDGYAISLLQSYMMHHELAHISQCLFHNEESDPVSEWYAPRGAALSRVLLKRSVFISGVEKRLVIIFPEQKCVFQL